MPGFDASVAEIRSAAVLLSDVGEGLRAELVSLTGEVDALAASWRGAAASAFARGWSQWATGARERSARWRRCRG
jgi:WXG100 family type VII secretion target